jgi:SAM-dependent methyltransferase
MSTAERWLDATWPFVRSELPAARATILEIGCGPLGGFVPMLLREDHEAVGVDPEAPEGPPYHRVEFEQYESPGPVEVVVASTSLHHVADLDEVLDAVKNVLVQGGTLIVVEWASERFDLPTARWCFDRLPEPDPDDHDWLRHHRDEWRASGRPWDDHLRTWRQQEGLHDSRAILRGLDERFDRRMCRYGPYLFPNLLDTSMAEEQEAIDSQLIQATGIHYVAQRR